MSALNFQVATGEASITSTAKTVITISAPSNQRVKIKGISIFGKGTSNTDTPVKVELMTYASISGGTAGSVTTSKQDGDMGETLQSTVNGNYSAEPTYTSPVTVQLWECHPQTGFSVFFPLHDEIILKGGTGFAVRLTSNQNETMSVNVTAEE
jgi:hypothetical protein